MIFPTKNGYVLLLENADEGPVFAIIQNILIINNSKYFDMLQLRIQEFDTDLNSFACTRTNIPLVISAVKLQYKWPQKMIL